MENTCCFIGHRKVKEEEKIRLHLEELIETLIQEEKIDIFLFGSRSCFNALCYEAVTSAKEKYPHIKRIYVRGEYPYVDKSYDDYLLKFYEESYFPEKIVGAGSASYVERNQEMINRSGICVFYYDENYLPPRRRYSKRDLFDYQPKSGTKIAFEYAVKKKKEIINVLQA